MRVLPSLAGGGRGREKELSNRNRLAVVVQVSGASGR